VIFVDEIDSTLNLDFRDDFFAAIRAIYNARAAESIYKRLTFALLGVATPTDLIRDRKRTPFNIGRRIVLQEFSYDEAQALKAGLEARHPGYGDVILHYIFYWTNGYPYLTQKLCLAAAERPATEWDKSRVDELVEATFFSDDGRKDPNFKFIQQRVQESPTAERRQTMRLYRKIYSGASVPDDDRSQSQNYLELYGLVRVEKGQLHVRNDIYRRIFDQKWIDENTPANKDLRLAVGSSLVALLLIIGVTLAILLRPSPSTELYVKQFDDNAFPTARVEALAGLFALQPGEDDSDDQVGLDLFYNLSQDEQRALFGQANAGAKRREVVAVIRRISLTLDDQDPNSLAIMDEMITALEAANQPSTDSLIEEIQSWKSGRELMKQGRYQDAAEAYNRTITSNPDNPAALYDRAMAYKALNQYWAALDDLDKIVDIAGQASTPVPTSPSAPTLSSTPSATRLPSTPELGNGTTIPGSPSPGAPTALPESTPGPGPARRPSRFVNADRIRETVAEAILSENGLLSYLQAHQTSYQHLRNISDLASALAHPPPEIGNITFGRKGVDPGDKGECRVISETLTILRDDLSDDPWLYFAMPFPDADKGKTIAWAVYRPDGSALYTNEERTLTPEDGFKSPCIWQGLQLDQDVMPGDYRLEITSGATKIYSQTFTIARSPTPSLPRPNRAPLGQFTFGRRGVDKAACTVNNPTDVISTAALSEDNYLYFASPYTVDQVGKELYWRLFKPDGAQSRGTMVRKLEDRWDLCFWQGFPKSSEPLGEYKLEVEYGGKIIYRKTFRLVEK